MGSVVDQEEMDALIAHVACAIYEKVGGKEASPQLDHMLQEIVLSPKNASNFVQDAAPFFRSEGATLMEQRIFVALYMLTDFSGDEANKLPLECHDAVPEALASQASPIEQHEEIPASISAKIAMMKKSLLYYHGAVSREQELALTQALDDCHRDGRLKKYIDGDLAMGDSIARQGMRCLTTKGARSDFMRVLDYLNGNRPIGSCTGELDFAELVRDNVSYDGSKHTNSTCFVVGSTVTLKYVHEQLLEKKKIDVSTTCEDLATWSELKLKKVSSTDNLVLGPNTVLWLQPKCKDMRNSTRDNARVLDTYVLRWSDGPKSYLIPSNPLKESSQARSKKRRRV